MTGDKDKDGGQSDKGKKSGKLWDSSDEETSSEEDFNWLEEKLKNKKDLNEEEKRLLKGILQPPFKDRKDPDYFKRLKYKGAGIAGVGTSDDSGVDETTLDAMRRRNRI
jgi:hypothetical protein